ncbi:MAG: hypothetical protein HQM03_08520 [Magnetococcales bacterium]|nr:hypothetical protein [Magnetococcales bacterium]
MPVDLPFSINEKRKTMPPETTCATTETTPDRKGPPHEIIPLVTVTSFDALAILLQTDKRWGRYAIEEGKANQLETQCARHGIDMPRCRYYYAGLAHEAFGDIAFAYRPEHEKRCQGWANPFDTGGVVLGKMRPFHTRDWRHAQTDRRRAACEFIKETRIGRAVWRRAFGKFLDRCYGGDVRPYLNGTPPKKPCPSEVSSSRQPPGEEARNLDRRAWTWEIRLECQPPLERGLLFWSCGWTRKTDIIQQFTNIDGRTARFPAVRRSALKEVEKMWAGPSIAQHPCDALQEKIIQWMQTQSP